MARNLVCLATSLVLFSSPAFAAGCFGGGSMQVVKLIVDASCFITTLGAPPVDCNEIKTKLNKACDEMAKVQAGMAELEQYKAIITPSLTAPVDKVVKTTVKKSKNFWGKTTKTTTTTDIDVVLTMGQALNTQFMNLGNLAIQLKTDLASASSDSDASAMVDGFNSSMGSMLDGAMNEAKEIDDRVIAVKKQVCVKKKGKAQTCTMK